MFADTEIPDINKQPHTDNASQIFNLYLMLMPQNHHSQIHEINIFYLKKKKKKNPWLEQFVFKMMFILQLNYVFSLLLILAFNS